MRSSRSGRLSPPISTLSQVLLLNTVGGFLLALLLFFMLSAKAVVVPTPSVTVSVQSPGLRPSTSDATETDLPEGMLPVSSLSIQGSSGGFDGANGVYYQNPSQIPIDPDSLPGQIPSLGPRHSGPQVLILHTHTSEAYSDGSAYYDPAVSTYDQDDRRNVVSVGDTVAAALERRGIETLHITAHCDTPSFNQAYAKSRTVAEEALDEHPSIRVILDLHRDSMISPQGVKYRTLIEADGLPTAQLMLVVGTSQSGLSHPGWKNNLALAARLYQLLEEETPGLMRPIYLSSNRYNQHLLPGAFLVEIGTCANTLAEADAAAELLAQAVARLIEESDSPAAK